MVAQSLTEFRWFTPLGVAVFLFLLQGLLTIVASLIAIVFNPRITTAPYRIEGGFLLSGRMDSLFYGKSMAEIIQANPQLLEIDRYTLYVRAGIWLAFGIFQIALTWFGIRQGQVWAFWTVMLANIAALSGWLAVIMPFVRKGIPLGLDLPPVVLLLAALILPIAGMIGWIGLH